MENVSTPTPPPVKSITVAKRFHQLGRGRLDEPQLQKLTYYAHGWSLVLLGGPLTSDELQAWELGPIYPEMTRSFEYDMDEALEKEQGKLVPSQMDLVKKVYESYGHYTGHKLSESTHEPHSLNPWHHVWHIRGLKNGKIEDTLIEHYFRLRLLPCFENLA